MEKGDTQHGGFSPVDLLETSKKMDTHLDTPETYGTKPSPKPKSLGLWMPRLKEPLVSPRIGLGSGPKASPSFCTVRRVRVRSDGKRRKAGPKRNSTNGGLIQRLAYLGRGSFPILEVAYGHLRAEQKIEPQYVSALVSLLSPFPQVQSRLSGQSFMRCKAQSKAKVFHL